MSTTNVCRHSQISSIQRLSYVNLERSQRLVSTNTHTMISRSKRVDDTDRQRVLTIQVPNEKYGWEFTNELADAQFMRLLEAVSCGESTAVDPDKEATDDGGESSNATNGKKPKAAPKRKQKPTTVRRQARKAAAGKKRPSA